MYVQIRVCIFHGFREIGTTGNRPFRDCSCSNKCVTIVSVYMRPCVTVCVSSLRTCDVREKIGEGGKEEETRERRGEERKKERERERDEERMKKEEKKKVVDYWELFLKGCVGPGRCRRGPRFALRRLPGLARILNSGKQLALPDAL